MLHLELEGFAENYYKLGLRINKHIPGYVEHYYGPADIKRAIDNESLQSPKKLLNDCRNLFDSLVEQGFEKRRINFLNKNLLAIETVLLILHGEAIPYLEKVQRLFDFKPEFYNDEYFTTLSLKAEKIYKGYGSLDKRMKIYSNKRIVPRKKLRMLFLKALDIAKKKTNILFPNLLPENEKIIVKEVQDQSWAMYNWYQGNYTSRLDINVSDLYYWTYLLDYACHEAYPGHHTESSVRDELLFHKQGYFETALLLIYTPEMVIHEGIGIKAEDVLFKPSESASILVNEFCLNKENEDSIKIIAEQAEIRKGFMKLNYNLAYHKYVDNWSDMELIKFIKTLKLISKEKMHSILKFVSDELWAPYILIYQGEHLIENKFGIRPSPKNFRKLITTQTLPSDLL